MSINLIKPPYIVPTIAEVKNVPWNGYNVISTFSGGGGSSTGYKMAGYKVLWANEFVKDARETYSANYPDVIVDSRDIREITGAEILDAINIPAGGLDIFDGSPPCASFSKSGSRQKNWGKIKKYSDVKQRTDDLFFEYIRILREVQPKVFVGENVSGLVAGKAKGYFLEIYKELKMSGYDVEARLLDA